MKSTLAYPDGFYNGQFADDLPRQSGFQLASSGVWYAFFGDDLRRSTDGGRTWPRLRVPQGTTMLRFLGERVGFAAAERDASASCQGSQQLWKTLDGAASWRALPGTCSVPPFASLDFLSKRVGFTSASYGPHGDTQRSPYVIVRATVDGGATWETRYIDRKGLWRSLTTVHFSDSRHGWALSHEGQGGATFDELHVSSDGGRSWQTKSIPAPPSAFAGASAWAGSDLSAPLWRTRDRGRTWQISVAPERIGPLSIDVANGNLLVLDTELGTIESRDGGRTWTTRRPLSRRQQAEANGATSFVRPVPNNNGGVPLVTPDVGRSWRTLSLVPPLARWDSGVDAAAFSDPQHGLVTSSALPPGPGLPVFATSDGGKHWHRIPVPPSIRHGTSTIAPGAVLLRDEYSDWPRTTIGLSTDNGEHWQKTSLPVNNSGYLDCSLSAPTKAALWIACTGDNGPDATRIFRSQDGATWTRLGGAVPFDSHIIAIDQSEAWAIGNGSTSGDGILWEKGDAALWHTTDGGLHWHEVWPTLPTTSRTYTTEQELVIG